MHYVRRYERGECIFIVVACRLGRPCTERRNAPIFSWAFRNDKERTENRNVIESFEYVNRLPISEINVRPKNAECDGITCAFSA